MVNQGWINAVYLSDGTHIATKILQTKGKLENSQINME